MAADRQDAVELAVCVSACYSHARQALMSPDLLLLRHSLQVTQFMFVQQERGSLALQYVVGGFHTRREGVGELGGVVCPYHPHSISTDRSCV